MTKNGLVDRQLYKPVAVGTLLTACLLTTYYFHFVLETEIVFTHFFYVPIVLAGLWWSRKGIAVAIFLAATLLGSRLLSPLDTPTGANVARTIMFIAVGAVVGILNEKRLLLEDKLRAYSRTLEQRVEERTTELAQTNERLEREIAEQVRAEESLQASERRFRSLYTAMNEGVCLHEMVYDESGEAIDYRIVDINPAYETALDITREEAVGRLASELYRASESPYLEVYAKVAATGEPTSFETYFPPMEKHFSISVVSPSKGSFATIFSDITERKQAEEALKEYSERLEEMVAERTTELNERVAEVEQLNRAMTSLLEDLQAAKGNLETSAARLREANKELADFAYVVSHDLKAPLRGITQLANWVSADYAETIDEGGQELLRLLTGRAKRMHNLIEGILQYSRVGRVREKEKPVDLNRLVQETIEGLAPPEHVRVTIADELPTVVGEQTRLIQVFQNLVSNGIRFLDKPEGWVTIGCVDGGAHWRFSVADNGPGIEKKYYSKIFQIFQTLVAARPGRIHRHRAGGGEKDRRNVGRKHLGGINGWPGEHVLLHTAQER